MNTNQVSNIKPTSVKIAGILTAIFSSFIIFSNALGGLFWFFMDLGQDAKTSMLASEFLIDSLFAYYLELCILMVIVGIAMLVGGVGLAKYRLWSSKLLTVSASLVVIVFLVITITLAITVGQSNAFPIFPVFALFTGLFWSSPFAFLIWFINRKATKKQLD